MQQASVLYDAPFEKTILTYTKAGGTGEDEWGQPIEVPGETAELIVSFAPFKRTQIQMAEGANPRIIEGKGSLLKPLNFPSEVGLDSVLKCSYAGKQWDARITNIITPSLIGVAFGAYFEATLTSATVTPSSTPDPDPEPPGEEEP